MKIFRQLFFLLIPFAVSELLWLANQAFSFTQAVAITFVYLSVLVLPEYLLNIHVHLVQSMKTAIQGERSSINFRSAFPLLVILAGICFFFAVDGPAGVIVFLVFICYSVFCMFAVEILSSNLSSWISWIITSGIALFFGGSIMGVLQIIERFSEEEFFTVVQVFLLGAWFFFVYFSWRVFSHSRNRLLALAHRPLLRVGTAVSLMIFILAGGIVLLNRYQASFFPPSVEMYPGITDDTPFFCGQTSTGIIPAAYDSGEVYRDLIERLVENPNKSAPLLGMLSLVAPEDRWREDFRQALLEEARQGMYTGPAGSVKYGQYEMSLRVYFFHEVDKKYPDLFHLEEKQAVINWFAAVNKRALTVEWVDWMYSTAFGEWPIGPYLNQEIGTSLLALLETYGYADPDLGGENRAFLSAHNMGWNQRFRNTDDSISYQTLWINNAVFQSLFTRVAPDDRVEKSFEWLLVQAVPDGSPVGYNPYRVSLAESAYLGAQMTGDGRYIWLAGRSLEYQQKHSLFPFAQPGLNGVVDLKSKQPDIGSCLIFADSGTPVKTGSLAPDKIVFRDGWQADDRYLNLNLRFTGWHRYKATNSIISIYEEEPLIIERTDSAPTSWLPVGRSMFRDKRIPRENLNGLVISRQGLSRLIFWMTGFGNPWAQDPPYYAEVESFQTGAEMDSSVTRMEWNGWTQVRSIYFVHDGPTVVVDDVIGPKNQSGGVVWHGVLPEDWEMEESSPVTNRFPLGRSGNAEMVVVPLAEGNISSSVDRESSQPGITVQFTSRTGTVKLVTLFLSESWQDATINVADGFLLVQIPGKSVKIRLPSTS